MKYLPIPCAQCGMECGSIGMGAAYAYENKWLCERHIGKVRILEINQASRALKVMHKRGISTDWSMV